MKTMKKQIALTALLILANALLFTSCATTKPQSERGRLGVCKEYP